MLCTYIQFTTKLMLKTLQSIDYDDWGHAIAVDKENKPTGKPITGTINIIDKNGDLREVIMNPESIVFNMKDVVFTCTKLI